MKSALARTAVICLSLVLLNCSNNSEAPTLTLHAVDGTTIELNENAPLTALFFFQMSNPVAIGAFEKIRERLNDDIDVVGIAMLVDRPPNVESMQQRMIMVPIVIDDGSIAKAFGGIDLTPSLILVHQGSQLLNQRGRLDYDAVNAFSTQ